MEIIQAIVLLTVYLTAVYFISRRLFKEQNELKTEFKKGSDTDA